MKKYVPIETRFRWQQTLSQKSLRETEQCSDRRFWNGRELKRKTAVSLSFVLVATFGTIADSSVQFSSDKKALQVHFAWCNQSGSTSEKSAFDVASGRRG
uniref:(northern house mosquito) hypothetical protein n=1 Tax=Culex pipiens TaxID=7175 RepID=A0A8D8PJ63_CULPI